MDYLIGLIKNLESDRAGLNGKDDAEKIEEIDRLTSSIHEE